MTIKKIFVGDIGTEIILEAGEPLTDQTTLQIRYIKPTGETGTWDAEVYGVGDTQAIYVTIEGDIDEAGVWKFQLYVELTDWLGYGTISTLEIYEPEW